MKKSEFFAQKKQFFVNDVAAVKDYVLTHCAQDQIDKIIARADEACAQSFRFLQTDKDDRCRAVKKAGTLSGNVRHLVLGGSGWRSERCHFLFCVAE